MNKRLFTFGCSFTNWYWPTWNDYIGLSFDEYYNFASGGADNKNILHRFLQVDKEYKFTSEDCVMIMFTTFNRMSYADNNCYIHNLGDIIDDDIEAHPMGKTYNFATGVYDSCIAIQSIKSILDSKNVKYEFLQSMKHNFYHEDFKARGDVKQELDYCLNLFKYPVMENWFYENYDFEKEKITWQDNGSRDGHPPMKHNFDYVKEFFPQYITDKVIEYYNINQKKFTDESNMKQEKRYRVLKKEFFKNEKIIII